MNDLIHRWQGTATALVFAGVAMLALAAFAFSRSPEKSVGAEHQYHQQGTFSYAAPSTSPGVYDSGAATTGEPIFFNLSTEATFSFAYAFASDAPMLSRTP